MKHWKKRLTLLCIATFVGSYIGATKSMAENYYYYREIKGQINNTAKNYPFCEDGYCIYSDDTNFNFEFQTKEITIENGDDIDNSIIIINNADGASIDQWIAESSNESVIASGDIRADINGARVSSEDINISSDEQLTIKVSAYIEGNLVDEESFAINTAYSYSTAFITTWQVSSGDTVTMPTDASSFYDGVVDWGDNTGSQTFSNSDMSNLTHTYSNAGTYTVEVRGDFQSLPIPQSGSFSDLPSQLKTVEQLGNTGWKTLRKAFRSAEHIEEITFGNNCGISDVSDIQGVFNMNDNWSGPAVNSLRKVNLSGCDLTDVTNYIDYLFFEANMLEEVNLSGWDMSNAVGGTYDMFNGADALDTITYNQTMSSEVYANFLKVLTDSNTYLRTIPEGTGVINAGSNVCANDDTTCLNNRILLGRKGWLLNDGMAPPEVGSGDPLEIYWDVTSAGETVTIPFYQYAGATTGTIDWGDGTVEEYDTTSGISHTYADAGEKTILISGDVLYNMYRLFENQTIPVEMDISFWDTSAVSRMDRMFYNATLPSGFDISTWDTSAVTNMSYMFRSVGGTTSLDLSGWDVSSVTNMYYMFEGASSLINLNLTGWDPSEVTNMSYMFRNASSLTSLDLSNWDVSNVTSMYNVFEGTSSLISLNLTGWNPSKLTNMQYMFKNLNSLESLDLSNWDVSNVTSMYGMFDGASALTSLNLTGWSVNKVTSTQYMFRGVNKVTNLDLSGWNTSNLTNMYYMFDGASSLVNVDFSGWDFSKVIINAESGGGGTVSTQVFSGVSSINKITYDTTMSSEQYNKFLNLMVNSSLRSNSSGIFEAGDNFCASTDNDCLIDRGVLEAKGWTINDVTTATPTISDKALKTYWTVDAGEKITFPFSSAAAAKGGVVDWGDGTVEAYGKIYDISHTYATAGVKTILLDGDLVTNMRLLFSGKTLNPDMDMSDWDVSNVTDMERMFQSYKGDTISLPNWNTTSLTHLLGLINWSRTDGVKHVNFRGWDTSDVTNMQGLLNGDYNIETLDLSGWDFSKVTSVGWMWAQISKVKTFTYDITVSQDVYTAFWEILGLSGAYLPNTSSGVIEAGTNSCDGNSDCLKYRQIILNKGWTINDATTESIGPGEGLITYWTVGSNETITLPFHANASPENLTIDWGDGSSGDYKISEGISHTYTDSGTYTIVLAGDLKTTNSLQYLFYTKTIPAGMDISAWNTSNITNMYAMFRGATIPSGLDISNWDTSGVTSMGYMFYQANIPNGFDISNWDTSSLTALYSFLREATINGTINIGNWDTSKVTNLSQVFYRAGDFNDWSITNWDTSNATSFTGAFYGTTATSLDLGWMDVSKATSMNELFRYAEDLTTLDLSGWELSNSVYINTAFSNMNSLSKIIYNDTVPSTTYSNFLRALSTGSLTSNYSGLIIKGNNECPIADGDVCGGYMVDLVGKGWTFVDTE